MFSLLILVVLAGVGAVAGFVDAIAGGGGLLALPVLLSVGLGPIAALATNKFQASIGTGVAVLTFRRAGFVALRTLVPAIIAAYAGGLAGAFSVQHVQTRSLEVIVPLALVAIAGYFVVAPRLSDADRAARLDFRYFVPALGFCIGFYDGIFGPGTGSFLTLGFVMLFGFGMTRAAGHAKVLNLTSNLAALTLFVPAGAVVWPAAIAMAMGQVLGGYLGARTGIRFGARLIRPLVILVSLALAARQLWVR